MVVGSRSASPSVSRYFSSRTCSSISATPARGWTSMPPSRLAVAHRLGEPLGRGNRLLVGDRLLESRPRRSARSGSTASRWRRNSSAGILLPGRAAGTVGSVTLGGSRS